MTVKSSVSLTDQQAAFVRSLVDQGRYSSVSAVIQQGIDLLRRQTEADEAELAALRAFFEERAKGPFLSMEEFEAQTNEMLLQKRRERGLED